MRVALIANRASGSGLDPKPLLQAMRSHGTEINADGEVRARGMERMTVERSAYALVVPD